jgi:dihydroflavonol-4-reductase
VGGDLQLFEADLLKEASFAEAIRDADYVIHMASPFIATVKDPQKELVDPAVNGTLAVLNACAFNPSVKRVVITSSMAAVTDSPEGILTEDHWNVKSSLKRNPYYFSKVEAERAAWKFMNSHKLHFDLVTILPFIVWGPSLSSGPSESISLISNIINGKFPVIMSLDFGVVDVRDVALAHILAIEKPQASGRYVCFDKKITMRDLVQLLRQVVPDPTYATKLPTTNADCGGGDLMMKFLANFQESGVRDYLQTTVGKNLQWDASKVKREMDLTFRLIEETVKDTVNFLIGTGQVGVLLYVSKIIRDQMSPVRIYRSR